MCMSEIGHVIEVDGRHATVDVQGQKKGIVLDALQIEGECVAPGQDVLIHTGFAVAILDPDEAAAMAREIAEIHGGGDEQ